MTPTMALSRAEKMRIEALPSLASEGTTKVSTARQSPVSGLSPAMKNPPSQIPKNRDTTTSRNTSASAIAISGGTRLIQPGH